MSRPFTENPSQQSSTAHTTVDCQPVNHNTQTPNIHTRQPTINVINSDTLDPNQLANLSHTPQEIPLSDKPEGLVYNMKIEQNLDPAIDKLIKRVRLNKLSAAESRKFIIHDEILYFISDADKRDPKLRVYVPSHIKDKILFEYHQIGHIGSRKLYLAIHEHFYWPKLLKDVINYVDTCILCQTVNLKAINAPIQEPNIPMFPFAHLSIDCVGRLPKTTLNNEYIIFFVCEYTGWVEAVPTKTITSDDIINAFYECIFWRYGSCLKVLTDNGGCFVSKQFVETMRELHISHVRTSNYHAQSNGKNERSHGTVKRHLIKLIGENPHNWDTALNIALGALRFNQCDTTKKSPYFLLFARDPILPINRLLGLHEKYNGEQFDKEMLQRSHEIYCKAFRNIQNSRKTRNMAINKNRRQVTYELNDAVYYKNFNRASKLTPSWRPYFRVIKVLTPTSVLIKNQLNSKIIKTHTNHIRHAKINHWTRPDRGQNIHPIRNCRYVVPPDSNSVSSEEDVYYQPEKGESNKNETTDPEPPQSNQRDNSDTGSSTHLKRPFSHQINKQPCNTQNVSNSNTHSNDTEQSDSSTYLKQPYMHQRIQSDNTNTQSAVRQKLRLSKTQRDDIYLSDNRNYNSSTLTPHKKLEQNTGSSSEDDLTLFELQKRLRRAHRMRLENKNTIPMT